MPVADVARTNVVTAHRDQSAGNLASVMVDEDVGSVVIEDDDQPVGIVTDRDLVVDVLEPRHEPAEVSAADIMTETPVTVATDDGVFDTTETMAEHAVRRLPVVDGDGALEGIVALDDLVVLLSDELGHLADVVEAESPPY
ncbi:CBS domain-containing protein [Halobacterium yunchengense]|uniref:CBS domain-containing protein n=1 Tax=Halobacterium yunchengense TaxID=3108497 RepID=UPI00300BCB3F